MKKIFSVIILLLCGLFTYSQINSLQLQGIIDFDLVSAGYTGKALHLKANSNISDLSNYGIGVANNGNGGRNIFQIKRKFLNKFNFYQVKL